MTDLESYIKNRRSVRKFKDGEIDPRKLGRMVELALWAPSSCNRQTVHYRFVKKREHINAIAPAAYNQRILSEPIILAVVCVDKGKYRNVTLKNNLAPYLDAGLSMQNFILAAAEMDLGSCVIAGRLNQGLIKNVLNLPRNWMVAALIAIGIPDESHNAPERNTVGFHMSYDNETAVLRESPYAEYIGLRRRWARAGFDVSLCYRFPKEGVPVFRHASEELKKLLKNDERWLLTSTLMGEFLFEEENVDHIAASQDEYWFLSDYLSRKASFVRCNPLEKDNALEGCAYDRIVCPFDIHFIGDADMTPFVENLAAWLKPGGILTLIFINKTSFWGLNHMFARLLGRDLSGIRYFGYETPISFKKAGTSFRKWFRPVHRRTVSFCPPPNVGYLMWRTKVLPLNLSRSFEFLGKIPLFGGLGNVAFLDLAPLRGGSDEAG